MYNDLTSPEGKYLLYLIDNISDLEKNFEDTLKDRDFKIKLILYKEYDEFKYNFTNQINMIKSEFDNLDLKNLSAKKMDKISSELNHLINEFEKKTEFKYVDNNS